MKSFFLALIIEAVIVSKPLHDYNLARFELRPLENQIELYVKVDRLDLLKAMQQNCKNYNYLGQCFEDYFNAHTTITFNQTEVAPKHRDHLFLDDFIEITFIINQMPHNINEIRIYSDLLLEISDKQENIVFSLLNDKRRSFRMNKDRTEIVIKY